MNILNLYKAVFYMAVIAILALSVNAIKLNNIEYSDRVQGRFLISEQIEHTNSEELQLQVAPTEINVDPRSTYNEKFMALMNSPCRPEYDGFFGATSGDPTRIQYGFQVEVQPLSPIMDILDIIEDKIVDSILQSSFPEMCGLRRRRKTQELPRKLLERFKDGTLSDKLIEEPKRSLAHEKGHPSGFRFLKFEQVEKCLPRLNEVNFCGIFTGVLYVYGKHQHGEEASRVILSYIDQVLNTSEPRDLHSELTLLSSVEKFSFVEDGHTSHTQTTSISIGDGLSRLEILLIIIAGLIFLAIVYYVYIRWNERRSDNLKSPFDSSSNGIVQDQFIDEEVNLRPYQDDRENSGVLL